MPVIVRFNGHVANDVLSKIKLRKERLHSTKDRYRVLNSILFYFKIKIILIDLRLYLFKGLLTAFRFS